MSFSIGVKPSPATCAVAVSDQQLIQRYNDEGYNMVLLPITNSKYRDTCQSAFQDQTPTEVPSPQLHEVNLLPGPHLKHTVGLVASWIELESSEGAIATFSRRVFEHELAYASYIGLTHVIIAPPKDTHQMANYSNAVAKALVRHPRLNLSVSLPMCEEPVAETGASPDFLSAWEMWNTLRVRCNHPAELLVSLALPKSPIPPYVVSRWLAEPVVCLLVSLSSFLINAKQHPVLSKNNQSIISTLLGVPKPPLLLLHGIERFETVAGEKAYYNYLRFMLRRVPACAADADVLRPPLEPIHGDLSHEVYSLFEKDPVKYEVYGQAIALAIDQLLVLLNLASPDTNALSSPTTHLTQVPNSPIESIAIDAHTLPERLKHTPVQLVTRDEDYSDSAFEFSPPVIPRPTQVTGKGLLPPRQAKPLSMVVAESPFSQAEFDWKPAERLAARSQPANPHRTSSLFPSENTPRVLRIAVLGAGRGPLVHQVLQALQKCGIADNQARVTAVEKNPHALIRLHQKNRDHWDSRVTIIESDIRSLNAQFDLVVSELLGSFGCNELSPECLQHVGTLLTPEGICIPESYQSYIVPAFSPMMDAAVRQLESPHKWHQSYVVNLKSVDCLSRIQKCWEFSHAPQKSSPPSSTSVSFTAASTPAALAPALTQASLARSHLSAFNVRHKGTVHGLIGYFTAVLYPGVLLSINPQFEAPNTPETGVTPGLQSWYPMWFPLETPLSVLDETEVEVDIRRECEDGAVWYEWCVESYIYVVGEDEEMTRVRTGGTPFHNTGGFHSRYQV